MAQFPSNPSLDSAAVPVRVVSSASATDRVANASDPSNNDSAVPVRIVGGSSGGGTDGVGISDVQATQGTVTAGQPSDVTLTTTLTSGATKQTSFTAPPGAPGTDGSDASVTSANIATALGYTAADASKVLGLSPAKSANLQTLTAPEDSSFGNTYAAIVSDYSGNALKFGCVSSYGTDWFSVRSVSGKPGLQIVDSSGNGANNGLSLHVSTDTSEIVCNTFGINAEYGGSLRWVNKDDAKYYWQVKPSSGLSTGNSPMQVQAGTTDGSAWQDPMMSMDPSTNTVSFLNEPITATVYTFATLPTSPVAWQRAIVTDKAIGSGAQGVMAMWNPNTKAWTGLGGETLV